MKKRALPLFLCLFLLLPACAPAAEPKASASGSAPAETGGEVLLTEPAVCDGFGPLAWGEGYQSLFGDEAPPEEGGRLESGFAGWECSACYQFHAEKGLYAGYYVFNEGGSWNDGTQVYLVLRRIVLALYGEHGQMMTGGEDGEVVPAPTIEEVVAAGGGQCVEVWGQVPTSRNTQVMVSLELSDSGRVTLSFFHNPGQL